MFHYGQHLYGQASDKMFHYGQCFVMGRLMMQHMCLCGQADECHAAECVSRTKRCGANGPKCCSVCTGTVL